jgi:hypothetical protein
VDVSQISRGLSSKLETEYWSAAVAAGELVQREPKQVWQLIMQYGVSSNEDVRAAVATCMLEHLLEHHFDEYFPLLETEILGGNRALGETFRICWKFGEAETPGNSERWNKLLEKLA